MKEIEREKEVMSHQLEMALTKLEKYKKKLRDQKTIKV